ncbi:MAG: hypothetical protein ACI358_07760 [Candidatus Limimorpha sp.]
MVELYSTAVLFLPAIPSSEFIIRATSDSPDMSLHRTTARQHEGYSEQSGLRLAQLFLRFKDGIDKLLVRKFPTIMFLSDVVGNVIFYYCCPVK